MKRSCPIPVPGLGVGHFLGILLTLPIRPDRTLQGCWSIAQWAVLLKKVWNIDALKCPKCCGQMKVISFI